MKNNRLNKGGKIKTSSKKSNSNVLQLVKSWLSRNIFKRTAIIIKKTFQDIFSFKKTIITLILVVIFPLIVVLLPTSVDFGLISPNHAATIIGFALIFPAFFWTLGLVYTIIIGTSGAPLIAEEVKSGTMLLLVSKPISRIKIFIGKYIAVYLWGMILSFFSIFMIGWIGVFAKSGNIDHFFSLIPFLTALYIYSLFILFLFTSITMAFSSIFKKARTASMLIILIVLLSYIAFLLIRTLTGPFYATYQLYHFDLGYHLGNVFILFVETLNAVPPSASWQLWFATITGVYSTVTTIDPDQNINLGGLEKTNYYLPVVSLLLWILIAALLLVFGIWSLRKREISV
ncbi:MAG TPA: ABC transporter permease [Candidatus Nanopelagicaceae bacterium]|nr:ABC transporter permease [Candidatus Nanopelagicaceae bacterium]